MFFILKKKKILLVALAVMFIFLSTGVCFLVKFTISPKATPVIAIDAGHGGIDGGAEGSFTDITESELNLKYALCLKKICESYGYKVVLTRKDMGGLYSPFASNKKRSEMEKRQEIIKNSNPDLVVSLHMNSFSMEKVRGSQVFYAEDSESGMALAESVQTSLNKNIEYAKKTAKVGDYYILNCSNCPSILVECGFLSNSEEEVLLQDEEYINKFCYHLFCGILSYFSFQ